MPVKTVGAFAIVFDANRRVLLSHRTDRGAWNLPGGSRRTWRNAIARGGA